MLQEIALSKLAGLKRDYPIMRAIPKVMGDRSFLQVSKDLLRVLRETIGYLAVPFLCAAVAWWLGQDTNWDLRNYHLYNAYAFLNDRQAMDLAPAGQQTWLNPLLDIFWYK